MGMHVCTREGSVARLGSKLAASKTVERRYTVIDEAVMKVGEGRSGALCVWELVKCRPYCGRLCYYGSVRPPLLNRDGNVAYLESLGRFID